MYGRHLDANLLIVATLKQWQEANRCTAAAMQTAADQVAKAARDAEWCAAYKNARNEAQAPPGGIGHLLNLYSNYSIYSSQRTHRNSNYYTH